VTGRQSGRIPASALARLRARAGFTLLELLIVLSLLAVAVGTVTLAIRDPAATQLEREAERLAALLEAGRAEARASGLSVRWQPVNVEGAEQDFRFIGLPDHLGLPVRWLNRGVRAEVIGLPFVVLGPDPIIGAQRLVLSMDDRRLVLGTDGLQPFALVREAASAQQ
jgi:general secretion pathway protein H